MSDIKYLYRGPVSGVTLPGGREVTLSPGREVTLPSKSPYVRRLVARKHLVALQTSDAAFQGGDGIATVADASVPPHTTHPNEVSAAVNDPKHTQQDGE